MTAITQAVQADACLPLAHVRQHLELQLRTSACLAVDLVLSKHAQLTYLLAEAGLGVLSSDVTVLILDRPRHKDIIKQCREAGARIRLVSDGDVAGAIQAAKAGAPVDVLMGVGGTPEGLAPLQAKGIRCAQHWIA